ncbi:MULTISPECIES: TIGR03862 family flavoprotein [Paraburkholderia]|uniref:TIGR03862 family flavoprotein n=1 Tax=Paraburkholderia TaxID=1822464 RepID=UPI0022544778|nr:MULTISPECIES: TIGR03862 family flavoprotein [Paraburkholderia]MCX4165817.1 TIGR03862 family flavoprotein [Paraburkholderia megapolitana]MDN7161308.1 TIGR03862 family flavoprotein [Paraburkholderia sp. CHISQ3]MDQ6498355.1 TIGR03862 family flavoprotein [Paraburkholderia megapolitana]
MPAPHDSTSVAIIGAGPAGLMAAEALSREHVQVDVYDAMPSAGRKFLMAGKGGMNITHSEPLERFVERYGARRAQIAPLLDRFGPDALRAWLYDLGVGTFVGSSGRVFPTDMKAAPMLRAWLHRLKERGVRFHMRHKWIGWNEDGATNGARHALRFATPDGEQNITTDALVLATGGASWPRLGSDAAWVPLLGARGVQAVPLRSANSGFDTVWSDYFRERFAGQPLKPVAITVVDVDKKVQNRKGEIVITATGIEGSLVYALSSVIRERIEADGEVTLHLDLVPDLSVERVTEEVMRPRGSRSLSSHLHSRIGVAGVKFALLHECLPKEALGDAALVARTLKALPLRLLRPRPIEEAISSAGGIPFEALDANLMIEQLPGVFCAGEMLDWEAPTGGYLLTACFASGLVAGEGVHAYLDRLARR